MQYNSSKENLEMPEYGRNVQLLVNYAKTIEDEEYRQAFAEKIIELMHQMNPQNRNMEDYKNKLWKHLFQIAKFDINVASPSGVPHTAEIALAKPAALPYPKHGIRFRHYGMNVQHMISKARAMEDEEKKKEYAGVIAAYMKLAYRTWNKEHFISDEIIKNDLETLSNGELIVTDSIYIDNSTSSRGGRSNDRGRRTNNNSSGRRSSSSGRTNNNRYSNSGGSKRSNYKRR